MKEIPVTNSGTDNLHVGGKMIRPGCTRMIDENQVPAHLRPDDQPAAEEQAPADPVLELLNGTVPEVVDALPSLSIEDLDRLEAAELADKNRKGVLEHIAADRLRRAAA